MAGGLPHFSNILVTGQQAGPGAEPQEVFYTNLFEVTINLPTALQQYSGQQLLLIQQATKMGSALGLSEKIEVKEQRYKTSTRAFASTPAKTHIEFNIGFNVNVNTNSNVEVWNVLKAWYDLVYNFNNGTMNYKRDMIGTVILDMHDKRGVVLRRITYNNAQLLSITGWTDPDWSSSEIHSLQADFVADYWTDEYIDDVDSTNGSIPNGVLPYTVYP
jgi:hypothetical protein